MKVEKKKTPLFDKKKSCFIVEIQTLVRNCTRLDSGSNMWKLLNGSLVRSLRSGSSNSRLHKDIVTADMLDVRFLKGNVDKSPAPSKAPNLKKLRQSFSPPPPPSHTKFQRN